MSTTIHDVVIVQIRGYIFNTPVHSPAPAPDLDAFRKGMPEWLRPCVIGPVKNPLDSGYTAFWMPDGSSEGWEDSDDADTWRRKFMDLFSFAYDDGSSPFDVIWVRFGPDMRAKKQRPALTEPFACYCPGDPSDPKGPGHKFSCQQYGRTKD